MSEKIRGLAAFDLDGTLLRGATVCEVLAGPLGRLEEMRRFETYTTENEVAAARLEMAEWYRERSLGELRGYLHGARWAIGAREAVKRLREGGIEVTILSVTWEFAVRWFAEQLSISHHCGTRLLPSGEVIHCWGRDKASYLKELIARYGLSPDRVAATGDSAGDIEMLREASLRFYVGKVPPTMEEVIHLPDADMRIIADRILAAWA